MTTLDVNKTPKKYALSLQMDLSKFEKASEDEKKQQEFYENNRQTLMLFEASVRYFKEHDIKKLPSAKALRDAIEDLISKKNDGYNEYREAKAHEKELQLAKDNILETLENQKPAREEKREK